jgi:membrane protein
MQALDNSRAAWRHVRWFASLPPRQIGSLLLQTYSEWSKHAAPRLGAALAYYTVFSIAPLLAVVIAVAGAVFGEAAARGQVFWQLERMAGKETAYVVQAALDAAAKPGHGLVATILGLTTLFFGASLVIAELRNSLNIIWNVPAKEENLGLLGGVREMLQGRLFAFLTALGVGFLLLLSLVVSTALSAAGKYFQGWLPIPEGGLQTVNILVWFVVTAFVFALIYKVLPDAKITWSDVIIGAVMTSLLFTAGRLLIALYLGKASPASAYGAAGSVVLLLAWVYYSAQVFFFGAEFTQVYANQYGSRLLARQRRWRKMRAGSQSSSASGSPPRAGAS